MQNNTLRCTVVYTKKFNKNIIIAYKYIYFINIIEQQCDSWSPYPYKYVICIYTVYTANSESAKPHPLNP